MAFTVTRNFVGVLITLTTADTNYNLLELVNAILAAESGTASASVAPGAARNVQIQSYPGIDSVGANTSDVLIGDGKLSATRMGAILSPGGFLSDRSPINNVTLGEYYARSAGSAQKLLVMVSAG